MKKCVLGLLLLGITAHLGCPTKLLASSWSLASCDSAGAQRWRAFEAAVRAAKPGSQLYTPKPYPVTDSQVIADYVYRFRRMHQAQGSAVAPLPVPNDERVVAAIVNDRVAYNVTRTENWTGMRCGFQHREDFYYIVQVLDAASGAEITRAVVGESGLFVSSSNMPVSNLVEPSAHRVLPSPPAAMEEVDGDLGVQGADPEYIATYGTINCDMAFPCLAFHQNGLSYVFYHKELFEMSLRGPKLTRGNEVGTWDKNAEEMKKLAPDERLISLGGTNWTIARKVSAAQVRHGVSAFP